MSLLKQVVKTYRQDELIKESAAGGAVSAGAVAGFRDRFFGGEKKKKKKVLRRKLPGSYHYIGENIEDEKFDSADVISKLKKAERRATHEDDTKGFALEDDEGRIVKVYVSADQAEDFEHALGAALSGDPDSESEIEGASTSLEIAEVLFNLKDRFTIVDVDWPSIEEDEEQEVEAPEGELPEGDSEGPLEGDIEGEGDETDMEAALQADDEMGGEMGGGPDMEGALTSIIDLLKSQADAQKAEAQAREAEANAEEAKYNAAAAEAKVKKEEEVLDMEAYYDEQGKKEKEAKQLAKLAKWKHETAQKASNELKGDAGEFSMPEKSEENEEIGDVWHKKNKFTYGPDINKDKNLQPGEFIKYLLKNVQGN